jgi:hypothetical protein
VFLIGIHIFFRVQFCCRSGRNSSSVVSFLDAIFILNDLQLLAKQLNFTFTVYTSRGRAVEAVPYEVVGIFN